MRMMFYERPALEEWRPVPGWEGAYEVSNWGRVRSIDHPLIDTMGRRYTRKGAIRNPTPERGYLRLRLHAFGREQNARVHILVAAAFLGPNPGGMKVCHNDGQPANNWPSNLRYDTDAGNKADELLHGTRRCLETHHRAKLTNSDALAIRAMKGRWGAHRVAKMFGIAKSGVWGIWCGETWKRLDASDAREPDIASVYEALLGGG